MNKDELRAEHERQIDMLLRDDVDGLNRYFGTAWTEMISPKSCWVHFDVWAKTGTINRSLFANPPGCLHCLTEMKGKFPELLVSERQVVDRLNIMSDDLVPESVPKLYRFTREQLEHLSELQIAARWPTEKSNPVATS